MTTISTASSFLPAELANIVNEFAHGLKESSIQILPLSNTSAFTDQDDAHVQFVTLENVTVQVRVTNVGFLITRIQLPKSAPTPHSIPPPVPLSETFSSFEGRIFESMDSLLQSISPGYRDRFVDKLRGKLLQIAQQEEENLK